MGLSSDNEIAFNGHAGMHFSQVVQNSDLIIGLPVFFEMKIGEGLLFWCWIGQASIHSCRHFVESQAVSSIWTASYARCVFVFYHVPSFC
jgi:hypothetical protein